MISFRELVVMYSKKKTSTGLLNANRKLTIYGFLILLLDLAFILLVLYLLGVFA